MTIENEQVQDVENTGVNQSESKPATNQTETKSNESTEVRNPDKLLEVFNKQKEELKELKAFKAEQDKAKSKLEQEKLLKEQQFEALIPIKIKEALEPYQTQLGELETTKKTLETKLQESEAKYKELEERQTRATHRAKVAESFGSVDGIVDNTTIDYLISVHGDKFKLNDKGELPDMNPFYDELKKTSIGSALFKAKVGSGSETTPQSSKTPKMETSTGIRVVTAQQAMNPKRHNFSMEDIRTGKVVIKG